MLVTKKSQLIVLQPQGRLDLEGGRTLEKQLAGLIPQRQDLWVIDLAKVDFMDSAGLVALIGGLKSARESSCRMVLCNVQDAVRLIFELTQLDSIFEILPSYDELLTKVNVPVVLAS